MFFVATRNISIAFLLTIFYIIIIDGILHEKRRFCLIPKKYINNSAVSSVEYNKALEIIDKYNKDNAVREVGSDNKDNYINYLSLIK